MNATPENVLCALNNCPVGHRSLGSGPDQTLNPSTCLDHLKGMADFSRFSQHDRCRTVFFGGEFDCTLNHSVSQATTRNDKSKVDARKHLRILIRTLRLQVRFTAPNIMAAFFENVQDIKGGAATHAH